MSIEEILESWKRSRAISPCSTDLRIFKRRDGEYRPFPNLIHPVLREALGKEGIEQLYSHQVEAIEAVHAGKDIVVVSPTASGKTLCYNLPVLNTKLETPFSKAFYLFPTKALSQDQMFELQSFIQGIGEPVTTSTCHVRARHIEDRQGPRPRDGPRNGRCPVRDHQGALRAGARAPGARALPLPRRGRRVRLLEAHTLHERLKRK